MSSVKKEIKYLDDNGEFLLEPIEEVIMTPELEIKLKKAIELVQDCGYYITDGSEIIEDDKINYMDLSHIEAYLFIIALQLLVCGLLIYQGHYSFIYFLIAFILFLLYAIYKTLKGK